MTMCDRCGKELNERAKFCAHCGAPVSQAANRQENAAHPAQDHSPQGNYPAQPPSQPPEPAAPQRGSYQPPVQSATPQQGGYQPPEPAAPQRGSYQPPVQPATPQQGDYQPPVQSAAPQQQGGYQPPEPAVPQQGSYQPPVQPATPQQGSYQPPVQSAAPQRGSYQPPAQPAAPQQGGYQPPVQSAAPQQQGGYQPPEPAAPQRQGGYQPPVQPATPQQQGGYQPPVQPAAQQQQGGYQPPVQPATPQQGGYQPPVQSATPQQGGYQPPEPAAPQQGGYQPPAQPAAPQQGGYQPPVQPAAPQRQGGYQPPVQSAAPQQQGGYQAQQTYSGQQTALKQKKSFNKNILLFGGIGIAVIAIIAVVVVLLLGGDKDQVDSNHPSNHAYVGVWNAVSVEMWEEKSPAEEIFGDNFYFEFMANNKCEIHTGEGKNTYQWEETEEEILITLNGKTIITCIKEDGALVVEDYMNTGLKIFFEKEGAKPTDDSAADVQSSGKPDIDAEEADAGIKIQEKWNGSWYGFLYFVDAYGEWEEYEDDLYDAYMVIDVDADGEGTMAIFIEDNEGQTVDSYIIADENHFEVTEGMFWDYELTLSQWWLAISPVDDGNLIVISDTYIDPEGTADDGFDYMFQFRPWGEMWEQEEKEVQEGQPGSKLPPGYDNYVATIESGVADPNAFEGVSTSSDELHSSEETLVYVNYAADMIWNDSDSYVEFDEYNDQDFHRIVITANTTLKEFKFIEVGFEENGDDIAFYEKAALYSLEELPAEKMFVVAWMEQGAIPHRGISFVDENHIAKQFTIQASGYDGTLSLAEF